MDKGPSNRPNGEDTNQDDELVEELEEIDMDQVIEMAQKDLHDQTTSALDIIKSTTTWLQESTSNQQSTNPTFVNRNMSRPDRQLEKDILRQNEDRVNSNDENAVETDEVIPPAIMTVPNTHDNNVTFS